MLQLFLGDQWLGAVTSWSPVSQTRCLLSFRGASRQPLASKRIQCTSQNVKSFLEKVQKVSLDVHNVATSPFNIRFLLFNMKYLTACTPTQVLWLIRPLLILKLGYKRSLNSTNQ